MARIVRHRLTIIAGVWGVGTTASAQTIPELRLTRDLRIDAAQHDLSPITPPGGMTVGPDGTIAFSQNQDGTIRFFDAQGKSLGSFGRKGQGPGEFGITSRFIWIGDTLLASDATTRRFTLLSPSRALVRTVPWLAAATMPAKTGAEAPRVRVSVPLMRYADGSQLVSLTLATGSTQPDWPGGEKPGVPIVRVDSLGVFQRLIAWRPSVNCFQSFDAGNGPGSGNVNIPFCPQVLDEPAPDGSRFVIAFAESGSSPAFRVLSFDANGDSVYARRFPYQPVAISRASRDSARATRARGTQGQRDAAAQMQIPESHPPMLRLLVGRDRSAWVERSTGQPDHTWMIVEATGATAGMVRVAANTRIMVVARDAAWAIETDDDGLQHIVRYRVSR